MLVDVYHPPQRYGLIYTDPPWPQKKGGFCKCRPNMKSRELDYPVMELSEIVQFHSQVLPHTGRKETQRIYVGHRKVSDSGRGIYE